MQWELQISVCGCVRARVSDLSVRWLPLSGRSVCLRVAFIRHFQSFTHSLLFSVVYLTQSRIRFTPSTTIHSLICTIHPCSSCGAQIWTRRWCCWRTLLCTSRSKCQKRKLRAARTVISCIDWWNTTRHAFRFTASPRHAPLHTALHRWACRGSRFSPAYPSCCPCGPFLSSANDGSRFKEYCFQRLVLPKPFRALGDILEVYSSAIQAANACWVIRIQRQIWTMQFERLSLS